MTALMASAVIALAGAVAGLCSAVIWIMLNVPSRVMHILGVHGTARFEWALLAGMLFGALTELPGASLHLGQAFGVLTMLQGGIMTGMMAAALGEVADIVPRFLCQVDLVRATPAICWAMAAGKAAGAFAATYWKLW